MAFLAPDIDGQPAQRRLLKRGLNTLKEGQSSAVGAISAGVDQAQPYLEQGSGLYDNLLADRQGATDMYYNSLGLNGQEGYDAALGAFQQGPGYQFALDQANQNVLRNNAAMGGVASGNTATALSDRAQQLQNMEFGNWQNRLQGLDVMPAISGKYNSLANLGSLFQGEGKDIAGVYGQFAPAIANQYGNMAGLIGQQQLMNANAQQQGISNALGLIGLGTSFFGA